MKAQCPECGSIELHVACHTMYKMIDGEFRGGVVTDGPDENLMNDTLTICAKCDFQGPFSLFDQDQPIPLVPSRQALWDNDLIQFARLLCEIRAVCECDTCSCGVLASMDIDQDQLDQLWSRAERVWEEAKDRWSNSRYCPPPKAKPEIGDRVGECRMPLCPHCRVALVRDGNDAPGFHHCPKCSSSFMSVRVRCDDCGWKGLECELALKLEELDHLSERLDVGGEVPAGSCPECNALAYLERSDNPILEHLYHISFLEVAYYGAEGEAPVSVTVECTKCGAVVKELFNAEFETPKCPECGELGYSSTEECSYCEDRKESS